MGTFPPSRNRPEDSSCCPAGSTDDWIHVLPDHRRSARYVSILRFLYFLFETQRLTCGFSPLRPSSRSNSISEPSSEPAGSAPGHTLPSALQPVQPTVVRKTLVDHASFPPLPSRFSVPRFVFRENDPSWAVEIQDDVIEECNKHGGVVHIYVDKNSTQVSYTPLRPACFLRAGLKRFLLSGQRVREVPLDSSGDGDRQRSSRTLVCRCVRRCRNVRAENSSTRLLLSSSLLRQNDNSCVCSSTNLPQPFPRFRDRQAAADAVTPIM